jgi:hypothetical protein
MPKTAQELIDEINAKAEAAVLEIREKAKAEAAKHRSEALGELQGKRREALAVLHGIESDIAALTGKSVRGSRGSSASKGLPDVPSPAALRSILAKAPDKRLNRKGINDAGYNLKSAIEIAKADKKTFDHKQNKAQGEVWIK